MAGPERRPTGHAPPNHPTTKTQRDSPTAPLLIAQPMHAPGQPPLETPAITTMRPPLPTPAPLQSPGPPELGCTLPRLTRRKNASKQTSRGKTATKPPKKTNKAEVAAPTLLTQTRRPRYPARQRATGISDIRSGNFERSTPNGPQGASNPQPFPPPANHHGMYRGRPKRPLNQAPIRLRTQKTAPPLTRTPISHQPRPRPFCR